MPSILPHAAGEISAAARRGDQVVTEADGENWTIDEHRERIASETLAQELGSGDAEGSKELKILESKVKLAVERV